MKFPLLITGAVVLAVAACKTPYKATDTPMPATDSTAQRTDTSTNQVSPSDSSIMQRDSSAMQRMDTTARMDTTMRRDSMNMTDTSRTHTMDNTMRDTAQARPSMDSAGANQSADSSNMNRGTDSTSATPGNVTRNSEAPEAVAAVFEKQYPGASNMEWSSFDSLAAVPIDLRLTGWKNLDPEDHMVKFDLNGESYYAWYDSKGKWIGSASPMEDMSKLPAAVKTAVNNAIKTRYKGYTISQVNREFQTGKKSYEVELSNEEEGKVRMMVSSAGKIGQIYRYKSDKK